MEKKQTADFMTKPPFTKLTQADFAVGARESGAAVASVEVDAIHTGTAIQTGTRLTLLCVCRRIDKRTGRDIRRGVGNALPGRPRTNRRNGKISVNRPFRLCTLKTIAHSGCKKMIRVNTMEGNQTRL